MNSGHTGGSARVTRPRSVVWRPCLCEIYGNKSLRGSCTKREQFLCGDDDTLATSGIEPSLRGSEKLIAKKLKGTMLTLPTVKRQVDGVYLRDKFLSCLNISSDKLELLNAKEYLIRWTHFTLDSFSFNQKQQARRKKTVVWPKDYMYVRPNIVLKSQGDSVEAVVAPVVKIGPDGRSLGTPMNMNGNAPPATAALPIEAISKPILQSPNVGVDANQFAANFPAGLDKLAMMALKRNQDGLVGRAGKKAKGDFYYVDDEDIEKLKDLPLKERVAALEKLLIEERKRVSLLSQALAGDGDKRKPV